VVELADLRGDTTFACRNVSGETRNAYSETGEGKKS
jgi:hypothetical protein